MSKQISASLMLCLIAVSQSLPAMAQQTAPSQWPGPWWMGSDGSWWQFWWLCPLVFVLMFLACMFFCFGRRSGTGAHQ